MDFGKNVDSKLNFSLNQKPVEFLLHFSPKIVHKLPKASLHFDLEFLPGIWF